MTYGEHALACELEPYYVKRKGMPCARPKATLMLTTGGFRGRRFARVELSAKVLDTPVKLRRTLLHEMCHLAAWLLPPHVVCPAGPPHVRFMPVWP